MTPTMTPSQSPPHEGEKRERKILIIGSKGMLGQALVEVFSKDYDVVAWDREEIDITNADCRFKIAELKPDLLINAAAYNDVDGAEENQDLANAVNGYAVRYLAHVCKELDIPIVHYSSDYVFDGEKREGYLETDQPNPLSAYGRSKLLGEQELANNTDKFYLIRLSRLFGNSTASPQPSPPSRGRGRKGEGVLRKKSFVELMLELAKTRSEIDVIDEELSCPTYAPDLASRTREIVEQNLPYGIYHSPNLGACTWYGFAESIFKIMQVNVKLNPVPASHFARKAKRPKYAVLLNNKLPLMRHWREALEEFLSKKC